ncbi:phosphogluconate dehydratase [Marinimicrobium sp. LS-A18]|uniref:phosphogluconate dehydratase n=1 Tax=Marinimicrobium sp. LS-A18 TaxID=1381596 RepID=UPI0004672EFC|nr:phosphogluconate dehydratase [Marinimicrobium sp. LS-A18]
MTHKRLSDITQRIIDRSRDTRAAYVERVNAMRNDGPSRQRLSCGNLAHGFAASSEKEKQQLMDTGAPNIGIVTAYNDMLSAHQPYVDYPEKIKTAALANGVTAQVAGGVPAMCDGVTQGRDGMDLSLFSRDVIAMSTAVSLSHDMFDAVHCLGICDKIVPGLMIGSLSFGHLPTVFVPAGPMPSGLPNSEKVKVRQLFAEGKVGRKELLKAEMDSYHSPGTCTFYGTANSNQMLMEMMGMQLPGSSFVNPGTGMRDALTTEATNQLVKLTQSGDQYTPIADVIDEKAVVNGIIGLLATGGSTNHTIHLTAIARAAGVIIDWQDMADLSEIIPLMCRVYPNGLADVNRFQAVGGMGFLIRSLLSEGLMHEDVTTIMGKGMSHFAKEPFLEGDKIEWRDAPEKSLDEDVLRPAGSAFGKTGGMALLKGNLGRCVIKVSAVKPENRKVKAPARVFYRQEDLQAAFKAGELDRDFVAVVRFQGPKANGMPELHKLTPPLGVLQDRGFKVALVTDGRMSGASGKIPAAIHLTPEALDGGPISLVRDGDMIELDADAGKLELLVSEEELASRQPEQTDISNSHYGMGRELFAPLRAEVGLAEEGATVFRW